MGNFIVYKHTSPSGKCYVGITSQAPEYRWGNNGYKYLEDVKSKSAQIESLQHDIETINACKEETEKFMENISQLIYNGVKYTVE